MGLARGQATGPFPLIVSLSAGPFTLSARFSVSIKDGAWHGRQHTPSRRIPRGRVPCGIGTGQPHGQGPPAHRRGLAPTWFGDRTSQSHPSVMAVLYSGNIGSSAWSAGREKNRAARPPPSWEGCRGGRPASEALRMKGGPPVAQGRHPSEGVLRNGSGRAGGSTLQPRKGDATLGEAPEGR